MRRILVIFALLVVPLRAQQTKAPQPAQSTQPSQADLDQLRRQQQQQELERASREAAAKADRAESQRQSQIYQGLTLPVSTEITEPCLARAMRRDGGLERRIDPLPKWVASGETTQIPWKIQIAAPELRVDQRYEITFSGSIKSKDLGWLPGPHELTFVNGISTLEGQWILPPKSGTQPFKDIGGTNFHVLFGDCLFAQPGDYILWMAIYDRMTERHNLVKRRIHVPAVPDDPLPKLNSRVPAAEFPETYLLDPRTPETPPANLFIPVSNTQAIAVEVVSIVSPSDRWLSRRDVIRWTGNRVLAASGVLTQLKLANGSISAFAIDLINRAITFQQPNLVSLDWSALAQTVASVNKVRPVSVQVLGKANSGAPFLRESIQKRLARPTDSLRVLILVTGTQVFERGSDLSPLKLEGDCRCRIYHVRFKANKDDVFDDVEKIIQTAHPRVFNVESARDMRKALAEIVADLESQY